MLRLIISCTRSWNFAWHLWRWTTDSKNIVKLLVTSQTIQILCCENDYFAKRKFKLFNNKPFPNSLGPLFQNKVKCSTFYMEMIFHSHANKSHFHKRGCALGLILKVRVFGTRKWPICLTQCTLFFQKDCFSVDDLFAVRYLWVVCHEDKCCFVTLRAAVRICCKWMHPFFRLTFNVYIDLDNRERTRERERAIKTKEIKFVRRKAGKNFIAAVSKWKVLVTTKVKMSGSEKKWTRTYTTFPPSIVW